MKSVKNKKKKANTAVDAAAMLLSSKSSFSVQEAYKTLRTNVIFSLPGSDCKCLGITSATRGEGKSTVAVNLAISLAQLDKRVVLIDCDMRLPTVVTKLGIKAEEGLSNYLSGMIQKLPVYRVEKCGIDIIPSGAIPPDATILIESDAMEDLIALLKESYDYIIFDFPPINIVSDAVLLVNQIDGYLMVVRNEYSEYQKLNEAFKQMRLAAANIIGFVYNGKDEGKKYYKKGKYGKYSKYGKYYSHYYYYKSSSSDKSGKSSHKKSSDHSDSAAKSDSTAKTDGSDKLDRRQSENVSPAPETVTKNAQTAAAEAESAVKNAEVAAKEAETAAKAAEAAAAETEKTAKEPEGKKKSKWRK